MHQLYTMSQGDDNSCELSLTNMYSSFWMLLAEKQVALEKLEWELKACNTKIEGLEVSTGLLEFEMSSLMQLFEKLYEDSSPGSENLAITSLWFDSVLTEVNCNFFCSIFKIFFSMYICLKPHLQKV
jgi:hypothetical protein